ncbi:DUF4097 family beta strand repeat-containing protein [Kribbella sp. CA-247076]|uniref:DUF4097 family beta strand repeat-containing protein n=1 Tax=Kribbella sp. CA-247076 TaxID=3239941 RepID=UPI003D950B03
MSEVQRRPASTMSTERRYGIAISVALILGGVYWALTGLTEDTRISQDSYPVQGDALAIDVRSADVEVRSGDGSDVKIERRFERNVFGSDPKESYEDGKLELRDTGCGFLSFGCDTHYVLTVPKDVKVTLESSSGDLKVSDLPAGADLKSSSGKIEVHNVGGALQMESSSGDLEAQGLTATTVSTQSSSGSVDLDFATAPQSVESESSSGDVTIRVPSGTEAYKVESDTSSGDETANVKSDPSATRTIKADTSSGDVTIEYGR